MLRSRFTTLFLLVLLSTSPLLALEKTESAKDASLTFRLPTAGGKVVELAADPAEKATVVCFLGAECPLARLYGPKLNEMQAAYDSRGVRFIGVNSNQQDSLEDVKEYVKRYEISFPMAKDYNNEVADQFEAVRTPEVFVLDQQLTVRYRGRIDNQYLPGISRAETTTHDLKNALDQLLAGKPIEVTETKPNGCFIGRVKQNEVTTKLTFCKEVAGVLHRHCVECHRTGEIAPFSLTDYDEVRGWADTMLETIEDGRMPPWHASPKYGHYANARFMSEKDKEILREWVAGGMPYGDIKDLPELPKFREGWHLPQVPEVVYEMRKRPFVVPKEGVVEYQYFVVDPGFKEDKWVTGAQVLPGNRSVVHHAIVFIRPPDGADFRGIGWLTAYVPGQRINMLPPGRARKVPAGSKLVFQMHYTPNGSVEEDISKVGLMFGKDEEITHEVFTLIGIDQEFEIPPHASDFPVSAKVRRIPPHAELLAIAPHMHLRGKSFRLFTKQDKKKEILLDVPNYDFNWQHIYELSKPMSLDKVDGLEFTVKFDNSKENPFNPDPNEYVTWGDQTWEEMAIAFFEVAEPRKHKAEKKTQPEKKLSKAEQQKKQAEEQKKRDAELKQKKEEQIEAFFKRFDKNGDGRVDLEEVPLATQRYGRIRDRNDDGVIQRDEL
ncbi:Thiol-disulfide oxidoreductase ResA [Gimesia panareensis]|uniref:Thiol-disulfide oxidoreductase ResA n=1 Tax=Gimesia panareensis TaxID=2527978 RepID=A0A518FJ70_9PLAN|nr:redoxin domain-containing protein [Gimesia panareensis]QDV16320.1 Thiol-disulfide oxidoreductase ResA [Gimesia panareensis]